MRRLGNAIGLDFVDVGILFVMGILLGTFALAASGCATSATPKGATFAQKLKDDMAAVAQVEADVKAQCGPQFAPLAATASSILSIAQGIAAAASGDVMGAINAAVAAFPALAADARALKCVYDVIKADYKKLKPSARLEWPAARRQVEALIEIPQICDSGTAEGSSACRPFIVDDDWPAFTTAEATPHVLGSVTTIVQ